MAITNIKKDESSITRASQPITPACVNIAGMAILPTVVAPVKNLLAFTQLLHHPIGSKKWRQLIILWFTSNSAKWQNFNFWLVLRGLACYLIQKTELNYRIQQKTAEAREETHTSILQGNNGTTLLSNEETNKDQHFYIEEIPSHPIPWKHPSISKLKYTKSKWAERKSLTH